MAHSSKMILRLAGELSHLKYSSSDADIEIPELELVLAFGLQLGTVHVKRIDLQGALRGDYWPEEIEGQSRFNLPVLDGASFIVFGEKDPDPSRPQSAAGIVAKTPIPLIELDDTSEDTTSTRSQMSSPRRQLPSTSTFAHAPNRLEDYPIERIDDTANPGGNSPGVTLLPQADDGVAPAPGHRTDFTLHHVVSQAFNDTPCAPTPNIDCFDVIGMEDISYPSMPRPNAPTQAEEVAQIPGSRSILPLLMGLANRGCTGELAFLPLADFPRIKCNFLPMVYDGNCIFELPPVLDDDTISTDISFDGHPWVKSNSYKSNLIEDAGLRVRKSFCSGSFICRSPECGHLTLHGIHNTLYWEGRCQAKPKVGNFPIDGDWRCSFCRWTPTCVSQCSSILWVVHHESDLYTRAVVHTGKHSHPSPPGRSREAYANMTVTIQKYLDKNPWLMDAPGWVGFRCAHRNFLDLIMHSTTVEEQEFLTESQLNEILETAPPYHDKGRVKYVVTKFRSDQERCIFALKKFSRYSYIQDSHFPGQSHNGIKFVFKMSTVGIGSGVAIVKRMQSGDLKDSFIMFDHIKRVNLWTTMAAHVYDHNLGRLLTIAVCEMKLENTENQVKFWELLIETVVHTGQPRPKFKGFMADAAPANYNAVRKVFGHSEGLDGNVGDEDPVPNPNDPILRTCYFHFVQSIRDHTNKWVHEKYRTHHVELCKRWAAAPTNEDFREIAFELEDFWTNSGAVHKDNLRNMMAWMTWWMARRTLFAYHHLNELELDLEREALVPNTNLCEAVHSSMWATSASGFKVKMDLYTVCAEDMTRSLLQQQFCLAASKGLLRGTGPSKAELMWRNAARSHKPERFAMAVKAAVEGTPFHSRGMGLEGDLDRTQNVRCQSRPGRRKMARSHRPDKDSRSIRPPLRHQPQGFREDQGRSNIGVEGLESNRSPDQVTEAEFAFAAPSTQRTFQRNLFESPIEERSIARQDSQQHRRDSPRHASVTEMAPAPTHRPDTYRQTRSYEAFHEDVMAPAPTQGPMTMTLNPSHSYRTRFHMSPSQYTTANRDRPLQETSHTPSEDDFAQSESFRFPESIPLRGTQQYRAQPSDYSFNIPGTGFSTPSTSYQTPRPTSGYEGSRDIFSGFQNTTPPPIDDNWSPQPTSFNPYPRCGVLESPAFQFHQPVVEKETDHKEWAIRRCLPNENPRCSAVIYRNGQWESCGRNIKPRPDSSHAGPSFYGTMEHRYKKSFQIYWFCGANVRGCVATDHVQLLRGGKPPALPSIWPVERGTKLSAEEAAKLGNGGFILVEAEVPHSGRSQRYQAGESTPAKQSPLDPLKRPPRRCGKRVNRRTLTDAGESRRKEGLMMTAQVRLLDEVPASGSYRFGLNTISRTTNKPVSYIVTISDTPGCNCPFFVSSVADSKNGQYFLTCKHMYHVYNVVVGLPLDDERPHQATLSRVEVDDIMRICRSLR